MCGIAGLVAEDLAPDLRERIVWRMVHALQHRGPDKQAVYTLGPATFGVARLSIVDRPMGHQPMTYPPGEPARWMIAYNGEVYNYLDLKSRLLHHRFALRTRCDTEVVLAAHAAWGDEALDEFDGMFAYAIWDNGLRRLTLARDRLGIKPLFYVQTDRALLFASEPKALFASGLLPREPDPAALLEFFAHGAAFAAGYVTGERSFFRGVRALPAGHLLVRGNSHTRLQRYWDPLSELGSPPRDSQAAAEELEQLVTSSVQSMLMGEVPIGTALSGGLDSSIITAVTAQALDEQLVSACITYSHNHDDPDAFHATLLSRWLNQRRPGSHRLAYTYLDLGTYLEDLDRMILAFDEPHWEPRQLAMFANYRTLAELGRTVVLTGEGSDELFFGYYRKFPGFRSPCFEDPTEFALAWQKRLPWVRTLLAPAFADPVFDQTAEEIVETALDRYLRPVWQATKDRLRSVQCWYIHTFLAWLLMVNDRCSMAHSLEGRFPYLSSALVSYALRLPPQWNVDSEGPVQEKLLLRKAFRDHLPVEIWQDRAKAPLPLPEAGSYHLMVAETLAEEMDRAAPEVWELISREAIGQMLAQFRVLAAEALRQPAGGETLGAYIPLDSPFRIRTQHLFGVLTLLRWYALNFPDKGGRTRHEQQAASTTVLERQR